MYTGKGDINKIRQYTHVNGKEFINFLKPQFDGNKTVSSFISPWATNISIVGTDAGANRVIYLDNSIETIFSFFN